ncbi:helix-turn-helix transcriptional regulator [Xinfangfangia sp. D13-10-4-6]|uniref:helix-turn-helix domain-containing protein n=1 Tax=Pseudogemmobacter hezensis TaxID=2737662 RepID=UPI001552F7A7|nr:helix-turn-helix transcriptional regulator [Pseudogemmobacter hezensis]NPD17169.1 helix-turn-helix transcriptional regulator [Pseudogemmobacter hezensis]
MDGDQDDFDRRLGTRMKELRTMRGLSLPDVAAEIGVSYQQMQKYEAGQNGLSVKRMLRIADLLGVDPHTVLKSAFPENCKDGFSGLEALQRRGERQRILKAYFSLPEDIRSAFLHLVEEVHSQTSRKP